MTLDTALERFIRHNASMRLKVDSSPQSRYSRWAALLSPLSQVAFVESRFSDAVIAFRNYLEAFTQELEDKVQRGWKMDHLAELSSPGPVLLAALTGEECLLGGLEERLIQHWGRLVLCRPDRRLATAIAVHAPTLIPEYERRIVAAWSNVNPRKGKLDVDDGRAILDRWMGAWHEQPRRSEGGKCSMPVAALLADSHWFREDDDQPVYGMAFDGPRSVFTCLVTLLDLMSCGDGDQAYDEASNLIEREIETDNASMYLVVAKCYQIMAAALSASHRGKFEDFAESFPRAATRLERSAQEIAEHGMG